MGEWRQAQCSSVWRGRKGEGGKIKKKKSEKGKERERRRKAGREGVRRERKRLALEWPYKAVTYMYMYHSVWKACMYMYNKCTHVSVCPYSGVCTYMYLYSTVCSE